MKLDDDKEAVNIINNAVGSLNNKARAIFNRGYMCGYEDGKREAVQMLERTLMDMTIADRKTENSSEKPNNSTISKMEQVEEPQTDCYDCAHWDYQREVCCRGGGCEFQKIRTDCPWK